MGKKKEKINKKNKINKSHCQNARERLDSLVKISNNDRRFVNFIRQIKWVRNKDTKIWTINLTIR